MSRHFICLMLLAGCALYVPLPARTPSQQSPAGASVAGRALDAQGSPLPGVTITITSPSGERSVMADQAGEYRFEGVALGRYEVRAALQGFQTVTRVLEISASSASISLDFSLDVGCLAADVRVIVPIEDVLRAVDIVARVRLLSRGERREWQARPPCRFKGVEYIASVEELVYARPGREVLPPTIPIIADELSISIGDQAFGFLLWSDTLQRFLMYGDGPATVRRGRVKADDPSLEELNGLTMTDATRVLRHLANLAPATPPDVASLPALTVPPERQLPACSLVQARSFASADEPGASRDVFKRLFTWSDAVPRDRRQEVESNLLPSANSVAQAYVASYRDGSTGSLLTVLGVQLREGVDMEHLWLIPAWSAHFRAIRSGSIIARVLDTRSVCAPAIAAHLRSLMP